MYYRELSYRAGISHEVLTFLHSRMWPK